INKSSIESRYKLIKKSFKDVGFLHGKLESYKKKEILDSFRDGKIKILISTVVIEVGIDIPDANIILIDHADRFGLAQIHQLRGRVGRGNENGICILLYKEPLTETALNRLITLKKSSDGFEIAEKDLIMRGGGEALGKKQYGFEIFLFFDLITHKKLINVAVNEAKEILEVDPKLQTERGRALIELLYLFEKNKAINLISAG
ncbi:helicase-related protein, partial [Pelagibacteraceae bacterium]|nr:helicase-related protein [Pelagibacteraceae bacterium]